MAERTVIGVFRSREQAEKALEELNREGFSENEISMVARDERKGEGGRDRGRGRQQRGAGFDDQDVSEGVATGGAVGGVGGLLASAGALAVPGVGPVLALGPLAATLSGAVAGGVAGGLIDWGIPEERGQYFEEEVRKGRVLAAVRSVEERVDRAANVLRRNGAQDVESHQVR